MILFDVEGPKAIGKTTLINKMMEEDRYQNIGKIIFHHFNSEDIMTRGKVAADAYQKSASYVYDRGFLSSFLYSFLYNVKSNLQIDFDSDRVIGGDFYAIQTTIEDLDYIVNHVDRYIILYAKHSDDLIEWINDRGRKRDTEQEKQTLRDQNDLYRMFGEFLNNRYDNVELYEVQSDHSKKLIKKQTIA